MRLYLNANMFVFLLFYHKDAACFISQTVTTILSETDVQLRGGILKHIRSTLLWTPFFFVIVYFSCIFFLTHFMAKQDRFSLLFFFLIKVQIPQSSSYIRQHLVLSVMAPKLKIVHFLFTDITLFGAQMTCPKGALNY